MVRNAASELKQIVDKMASGNVLIGPGVGFGKTADQSIELMKGVVEFRVAMENNPFLVRLSKQEVVDDGTDDADEGSIRGREA